MRVFAVHWTVGIAYAFISLLFRGIAAVPHRLELLDTNTDDRSLSDRSYLVQNSRHSGVETRASIILLEGLVRVWFALVWRSNTLILRASTVGFNISYIPCLRILKLFLYIIVKKRKRII